FLVFYHRLLAHEIGARAAWFATGILATSAGWMTYSQIAVTDLPLAVTFSAAMLVALPWLNGGSPGRLWIGGALLGLAVLAKGLVPLALAAPLLWFGRKRWKDLIVPALVMLVVAAPWYLSMSARHGASFLADFFWKHHFQRVTSDSLQHVEPFWYYIPVLLAGLFPWTPLLLWGRLSSRQPAPRPALLFLLTWAVFGFLFFSIPTNKLPGYLLPILPPIAALLGVRLDNSPRARWLLIPCALLLAAVPVIAAILPAAVADGLGKAESPGLQLAGIGIAAGLGLVVWDLLRRRRTVAAWTLVALSSIGAVIYIKETAYPSLDASVSSRGAMRRLALRPATACSEDLERGTVYGLSYYLGEALPSCQDAARPVRLAETPRGAAIQ
ncbi:MAG: hypothetical protein ACRD44_00515, partial [Bryobacteraceae bacterium]